MNTWGQKLKLSIFGQSHGRAIGIVIDGLPAGLSIDTEKIHTEMQRRAPGKSELSTQRKESDKTEIVSGLLKDKTTGFPICGLIYNEDAHSEDYDTLIRPGHADMSAHIKYGGYADMRGGGHFSGRLTAPLTFAGSIAKQVLYNYGICVCGRILAIGGVTDTEDNLSQESFQEICHKDFPVANNFAGELMKAEILKAKEEGDSVGGIVETVAFGVMPGLGEPFFYSMESAVSSMMFSIPAVKGVEFGEGFGFANMKGSRANDPIISDNGILKTLTNHNGGILGGITNGMPITVKVVFKPTPSIAQRQQTVDVQTMKEISINIKGRHDPCIVPRAVPVAEAGLALSILDCLLCGGF